MNNPMSIAVQRLLTGAALAALMWGCAAQPVPEPAPPVVVQEPPRVAEPSREKEPERQTLSKRRAADLERLRQCQEEKRRLEAALQETQSRLDATQKKLDAVIAIERNMRPKAN